MTNTASTKAELELTKSVKELSKQVKRMKNLEFLRVFKNPWKFMWFSFLKGVMVGLGSVMGASVVFAFVVYLVAQIISVPVLGDFVEDIMTEVRLNETFKLEEIVPPAEPVEELPIIE